LRAFSILPLVTVGEEQPAPLQQDRPAHAGFQASADLLSLKISEHARR
jgi:hypothetical protein